MKRRTFALTALTLPALLAACGGGDSGAIRAGSTGQSYPNSFQKDGKLVGFDVEVIETIAEKLDRKVTWTNADFSGLMGQLEARKLDTVANNVALTKERSEQYDFSKPYAYMGATVVRLGKNSQWKTLEDMDGHTIAGVLGSNNVTHLKNWAKEHKVEFDIRTYETRDGAMQDLLGGRVDGYINSTGIFLAEIEKTGADLEFVGDPIAWEAVGFPFEKGSDLVAQVDEQITALTKDGTLKKLSKKYFGDDVTAEPEGFEGS